MSSIAKDKLSIFRCLTLSWRPHVDMTNIDGDIGKTHVHRVSICTVLSPMNMIVSPNYPRDWIWTWETSGEEGSADNIGAKILPIRVGTPILVSPMNMIVSPNLWDMRWWKGSGPKASKWDWQPVVGELCLPISVGTPMLVRPINIIVSPNPCGIFCCPI